MIIQAYVVGVGDGRYVKGIRTDLDSIEDFEEVVSQFESRISLAMKSIWELKKEGLYKGGRTVSYTQEGGSESLVARAKAVEPHRTDSVNYTITDVTGTRRFEFIQGEPFANMILGSFDGGLNLILVPISANPDYDKVSLVIQILTLIINQNTPRDVFPDIFRDDLSERSVGSLG